MRTALALLPLMFAGQSPASEPEYHASDLGLPFSEAVQAGDTLYLAGQIGAPPGSKQVVAGGIEAESVQVMENINAVLKRRGLGFDALVKCTVMLADMKDWPAFNTMYARYFKPGRFPARSAFGTSGLAYNARVELECWAYNPKD